MKAYEKSAIKTMVACGAANAVMTMVENYIRRRPRSLLQQLRRPTTSHEKHGKTPPQE